jgi:hypothetical protein
VAKQTTVWKAERRRGEGRETGEAGNRVRLGRERHGICYQQRYGQSRSVYCIVIRMQAFEMGEGAEKRDPSLGMTILEWRGFNSLRYKGLGTRRFSFSGIVRRTECRSPRVAQGMGHRPVVSNAHGVLAVI